TTGNKSELAVGYSTLYGDMAGGFAPIKDVPKTLVYELCRWRNERDEAGPIPDRVLEKPPSAELRPEQKDTDSLPAYELLDPIIEAYVEDDRAPEALIASGLADAETVRKVVARSGSRSLVVVGGGGRYWRAADRRSAGHTWVARVCRTGVRVSAEVPDVAARGDRLPFPPGRAVAVVGEVLEAAGQAIVGGPAPDG